MQQDFLLRGYRHFLSVLVNCFCFKSCWANHFTVCLSMDAVKKFQTSTSQHVFQFLLKYILYLLTRRIQIKGLFNL